ncbi:MAG TPA: glycosyltransferase family 39 protein [Planctomycetota bacterium]|nr:glycosyltransferase family 39 protein [Planctomycetota bacterium]HRR82771.1 glycosyltransferase family 39 protein [Planctomycetota bacterium]HRT93696.1 glycosyltransferase family 39 protein [Planctomycetota bacterium]
MNDEAGGVARGPGRAWPWLVACLVVGLGARLAVVAVPYTMSSAQLMGRSLTCWAEQPFFPDSLEYLSVAHSLRHGEGFAVDRASRIGRMPAYPLLIAGLQAIFGDGLLPVRVGDAVLGTALIALVYLLGMELYGRREAVIAAGITAAYPFLVVQAVLVLSETLFMAFMVAGALFVGKAWKHPRAAWGALAGLMFGLATLTRGSYLAVAPLTAFGFVVGRRAERRACGWAARMLSVFALTLTPWVARNWSASDGHLVVTTLRVGPSLYEGLNEDADGGPMMDRINWDEGTAGMSEYERSRHWRDLALRYAREHPDRVLGLAVVKLGRFWNVVPNLGQLRGAAPCVVFGAPYVLVMALAVAGLLVSRRGDVALILLLPVVYYCLVHTVFVGSIRYREALMPLLIVMAARGIVAAWARLKSRGNSATTDPASARSAG